MTDFQNYWQLTGCRVEGSAKEQAQAHWDAGRGAPGLDGRELNKLRADLTAARANDQKQRDYIEQQQAVIERVGAERDQLQTELRKLRRDLEGEIRVGNALREQLNQRKAGDEPCAQHHVEAAAGSTELDADKAAAWKVICVYRDNIEQLKRQCAEQQEEIAELKRQRLALDNMYQAAEDQCAELITPPDTLAAHDRELRKAILIPANCEVSGHFKFQENGSICMMCQREERLRDAATSELRQEVERLKVDKFLLMRGKP